MIVTTNMRGLPEHAPSTAGSGADIAGLPGPAVVAMRHVLDGKCSGAVLAHLTPKHLLGRVAVSLHLSNAPAYGLRDVVAAAWTRAHADTIRDAGDNLVAMFRAAQFPVPASLPDTVTMWRATRGVQIDVARAGLSWTTNRDFACEWLNFLRHKGVRGNGLVLRRDVPRSAIVFFNDNGEQETIAEMVLDAPPAGEVDGDAADWNAAARAFRGRLRRGRIAQAALAVACRAGGP